MRTGSEWPLHGAADGYLQLFAILDTPLTNDVDTCLMILAGFLISFLCRVYICAVNPVNSTQRTQATTLRLCVDTLP